MITLHKLNGNTIVLNAELIETVESTPDTLVTLVDRRRMMVVESVDEVVDLFMDYRRAITPSPLTLGAVGPGHMLALGDR